MQQIFLVVHLLIALALVGVVLLQRNEGGGLGMGGGTGSLMSVRGSANLLTRATGILAGCFMLTSILLAILAGGSAPSRAIVEEVPAATDAPVESDAPAVPLDN